MEEKKVHLWNTESELGGKRGNSLLKKNISCSYETVTEVRPLTIV